MEVPEAVTVMVEETHPLPEVSPIGHMTPHRSRGAVIIATGVTEVRRSSELLSVFPHSDSANSIN